MELIFGTTNQRKVEDLRNIIKESSLNIEVLDLNDINWDMGEIEETGSTINENSLIKARAILSFCKEHNLTYPIITDDAGLFVDALNGEPGIYTARYADKEISNNPTLPKYQGIIKLLDKLKDEDSRQACYRCCVTVMLPNGDYYQVVDESKGIIAKDIIGEIKKPYFYSIFILEGTNVAFNQLKGKELDDTYRYKALRKSLKYINKKY